MSSADQFSDGCTYAAASLLSIYAEQVLASGRQQATSGRNGRIAEGMPLRALDLA